MMLFNRRNDLAQDFEKWAEENKFAKSAFNVITYLCKEGLLKDEPGNSAGLKIPDNILERMKNETVETEGTINRLVKTAKELFEKDWVRKGWIRDVAERACKVLEEDDK